LSAFDLVTESKKWTRVMGFLPKLFCRVGIVAVHLPYRSNSTILGSTLHILWQRRSPYELNYSLNKLIVTE
jgi:hypothetical protein